MSEFLVRRRQVVNTFSFVGFFLCPSCYCSVRTAAGIYTRRAWRNFNKVLFSGKDNRMFSRFLPVSVSLSLPTPAIKHASIVHFVVDFHL